ncbi:helicase associated domain-containing protein (plasmid) [Streptomycetaceae bacterium NBC_01309]
MRACPVICCVPQRYVSPTGYRLGSKINTTRTTPHRVPESVRAVLDDLGMVWNTRDVDWQQFRSACQAYAAAHGHLDIPGSYTTEDGYRLGGRITRARRRAAEGTLDPAERARLEELGIDLTTRNRADRAWEHFLAACDRYTADHGSLANIEKAYVDDTGYALGARVSYYRTLDNGTREGSIPAQRRRALDDRGMIWRIAPRGDLTPAQAEHLRTLHGTELGTAVLALTDTGITQKSIAAALGMHRSYLNIKIRAYRATGAWPSRTAPAGRTP